MRTDDMLSYHVLLYCNRYGLCAVLAVIDSGDVRYSPHY